MGFVGVGDFLHGGGVKFESAIVLFAIGEVGGA